MLTIHIHIQNGPEITLEAEDDNSKDKLLSLVQGILLQSYFPNNQSSLQSAIFTTDHNNGTKPDHLSQKNQTLKTDSPRQQFQFTTFCKDHDPRSDRGRVLVAAEGARLFLSMNYISTEELKPLFDAVGWPQPIDLVTTIRNASRKNCGWIERVRGKQGYYAVTEKGRNTMVS